MAKKQKQEIAELKSPDQFVSFWTRVGERVSRHRRGLVTVVVTILAATAALQVGRFVFSKRDAETSRAFAKIEQVATAPLLPAEGEAPKFDDGVPHFKTDDERKQAALKEVEAFLSAHNKGKLVPLAKLLQASFLRDLGKNTEAIAIYQPLISGDDLGNDMQLVALDGLALAQEAAGQTDAALATLDKLHAAAKSQHGFMGDRALYTKARLLESNGKAEEAKALYKSISTDYPNTTLREEVTRRLALLDEATSGAAAPSATDEHKPQ